MIFLNTKTLYVRTRAEKDIVTNRYSGIRIRARLGKVLDGIGIKISGQYGDTPPSYSLSDIPILRHIDAPCDIDFSLNLYGKPVIKQLDYRAALRSARFIVLGDSDDGSAGQVRIDENILDMWGKPLEYMKNNRDSLIFLPPEKLTRKMNKVTLKPISPLLLNARNREGFTPDQLEVDDVIRSMVSRIERLNFHHKLGFPEAVIADIESNHFALTVKPLKSDIVNSHYFQKDRKKDVLKLTGGILNSMEISGEMTVLMPALIVCEKLHIGESSSFGMGQFRMEFTEGSKMSEVDSERLRGLLLDREPIYRQVELKDQTDATNKNIRAYNDGTYIPGHARQFIHKSGRKITMAEPLDKIFEMHTEEYLNLYVDPLLGDNIYGYRKGKGAIKAVRRVRHEIMHGKMRYALRLDIDDFFGSIDRDILYAILEKFHIAENIRCFVMAMISRGIVDGRQQWHDSEGIPQGGIISPVLSNMYLHIFDSYIKEFHPKVCYFRYADDLIFLSKGEGSLGRIRLDIPGYLENAFGLRFNSLEEIIDLQKLPVEYLGLTIGRDRMDMSRDKFLAKRDDLIDIFERHRDEADYCRILLEQRFESWRGYYGNLLGGDWGNLKGRLVTAFEEKTGSDLLSHLKPGQKRTKTARVHAETRIKISRLIEKSKEEFLEMVGERSTIVVDTPGTFLGRRGRKLYVRTKKGRLRIPFVHIHRIIVSRFTGVSMSASLLHALTGENIPLTMLDFYGNPVVYVTSPAKGQRSLFVLQLEAQTDERGFEIARSVVLAKIVNQEHLCRYWSKNKPEKTKAEFRQRADAIKEIARQVKQMEITNDFRQDLMGMEAQSSALYWRAFDMALRDDNFPRRVKKGAEDRINSVLNYGYGFLRNEVNNALSIEGLDVTISFLHAAQPNKPTLVYDIMEQFRQPFIDREVVSMFNKGRTIEVENGLLTDESRLYIIERFNRRFSQTVKRGGKLYIGRDMITETAARLAAYIQGRSDKYRCFTLRDW